MNKRPVNLSSGQTYLTTTLATGELVKASLCDRATLERWSWCRSDEEYPYARANDNGRYFLFHREILGIDDGRRIDHKNGDTLDCRRENLRVATKSQNGANIHKVRSATGRKGVFFCCDSKVNPYRVQVGVGGKIRYVGRYATLELATAAYDEMAVALHGEFAATNVPRETYNHP